MQTTSLVMAGTRGLIGYFVRWSFCLSTIPNQSSSAIAYKEFDDARRMEPSSYYDRIIVMEELVRITLLMWPHAEQLVDRYSEGKEAILPIDPATDHSAIAIAPQSANA